MRKTLVYICLMLALSTTSANALDATDVSIAGIDEESNLVEIEESLEGYIFKSDNGYPEFDVDRAQADGASDFALSVGKALNQVSTEYAERDNNRVSRGMPGYKRWCGPGNSGPGAPVNTLDRLCMHHDKCYARKGYFNCSCDRELLAGINRDYNRMVGFEKVMANAIKVYFTHAPCR